MTDQLPLPLPPTKQAALAALLEAVQEDRRDQAELDRRWPGLGDPEYAVLEARIAARDSRWDGLWGGLWEAHGNHLPDGLTRAILEYHARAWEPSREELGEFCAQAGAYDGREEAA